MRGTGSTSEIRSFAGTLALVALAGFGGAATVLSIDRAGAVARERDVQLVELVSERVSSRLTSSVSSLRGADGLAVDGRIDEVEFRALFEGLLTDSVFAVMTYAEVVPESERSNWEAANGIPIVDPVAQGGLGPAASRPQHVAVALVEPENEQTHRLFGFDWMSEEIRAEGVTRAAATGLPAVVGPVSLLTNARPGIFVVHSVRDRDGNVIGYLSSGVDLDRLTQTIGDLASPDDVSLELGNIPLTERAVGGATSSFSLGGQTFTVRADDRRPRGWLLTGVMLIGTLGATVVAARGQRLQRRERRRQRMVAERNARIASLVERFAEASSVQTVIDIATAHAGQAIGADHVSVGRVDSAARTGLIVQGDGRMGGDQAVGAAVQRLDQPNALTDSVRRGQTVRLPTRRAIRSAYPEAGEIEQAGIRAAICVPVSVGQDPSDAVLGFWWKVEMSPQEFDDQTAAATLIAEIIGRALERVVIREVVKDRVDQLGAFTRAVSAARTSREIAHIVEMALPPVLDARSVCVVDEASGGSDEGTDAADTIRRSYPLPTVDGTVLVIEWPRLQARSSTAESLALTIVELVDSALSRARQHDQEHSVLQQLQTSLLMAAPSVAGFEIAVAYESALDAVGIGGDWYSVIDRTDSVLFVIGDVAGHGPGAVAIMAEAKTIVRHMLSEGEGIDTVLRHADTSLQRHEAYASTVIVRIDKLTHRLTYVNAGHPPPVLRNEGKNLTLGASHRPWLGVDSGDDDVHSTECDFGPGDTLVLYTDGLIEQRGELIDVSIDRMMEVIDDSSPSQTVKTLLEYRAAKRNAASVDDDVALLVVRRQRDPQPGACQC